MVGWPHWLDVREFEQAPGVGDGQGGLACCSPRGRKESDTTERLNNSSISWHSFLFLNFVYFLIKCLIALGLGGARWRPLVVASCGAGLPAGAAAPAAGRRLWSPASAEQRAGSAVGAHGLSRPGHVGLNPVPLAGGWIFNHRTTREVRGACLLWRSQVMLRGHLCQRGLATKLEQLKGS